MYESDNSNFGDICCTWNAWHVIGMIFFAWQTVCVRKAHKMAMKVKLCKIRHIKRLSRTFAYLMIKFNFWSVYDSMNRQKIEVITHLHFHSSINF